MDFKEFFSAFLGKTLNMPADKVASLLTDDGKEVKAEALTELLSLDTARVQKFKDENQTFFDNGHKKATKEALATRDKSIKEKYGITSDKIGDELIDEIITAKAADKSAIDEAKVKSHPAYTSMQNELNQKIVEQDKQWKTKWDTAEQERAYEQTFSKMWEKAETLLPGFQLPEDAEIKKNQLSWIKEEFKKSNFDLNDNDFIVKTKEGKLMEDGHGNRVTFESFSKGIFGKYFPAIKAQPRSGPGEKQQQGAPGQNTAANAWKGKITNDAEYTAAISKAADGKERISIQDAYNEHKASKSGQ